MSNDRLTDDELDEAMEVAKSLHSLRLVAVCAELKGRRAADLTAEEREDIERLAHDLKTWREVRDYFGNNHGRALAALSKLAPRGGK